MVVVRNANRDYNVGQITVTSTTTFTLQTDNVGGTSGTEAAYIPCPYVSSITEGAATITVAGGASVAVTQQILSVKITTGTKTTTTFALTMPLGQNRGAGANSSLTNMNPPLTSVIKLNDGTVNTGAAISVNTSSNFNVFTLGGINTFINNLLRFNF